MPTDARLDWTELDDRAVDTVRVLAMDSVQKVGNGHPGTAMSLAPAAYLLFQKVMRHNPADPNWPGRDRFVLSCGHTSLTLYIQLYLGGWGLELEDLKSLRTWNSKTPGHPEYGHTAGVETTTGPLGQGIGNAVGMAMAARRERGLLDPNAAPGESVFDHQIYALASDGDIEEGVSSEASSLAGTQQLGNLTLIYDENKISIEDDTDVALSEDVAKRYEAYGWHVQVVDWTNGGARYEEDVPALYKAIRAAERVTDQPSIIVLRTIIAWPAPNAQNTGEAHGSALGEDEVAATKKILGFDPEQTFAVPEDVIEHTRKAVDRGKDEQAQWREKYVAWTRKPSADPALFERMETRTLPDGWDSDLPSWPADPKGVATRKASGAVINAVARQGARALGRLGRPRRVQQHHHQGRALVHPEEPLDEDVAGRPVRRARAPLRRPRARHGRDPQRDRSTRRHPRLRGDLPDLLRLHAPLGPAGRADAAAGDLRLDPRLHRARRGRTDPPADRAPGRAAGHPRPGRRTPCGRERDGGLLADGARAQRPARRHRADPPERPGVPPQRGRLQRHQQRAPRRLRAARRRGRGARRRAGRHRLRGPAGRRWPGTSWPSRASAPASSRCRAGSGSRSRTPPTGRP